MILDDGGDLTALMHKNYKDMLKNIKGSFRRKNNKLIALKKMEEKRIIRFRLLRWKMQFLNQSLIIYVGCRESLSMALKELLDVMMSGKV